MAYQYNPLIANIQAQGSTQLQSSQNAGAVDEETEKVTEQTAKCKVTKKYTPQINYEGEPMGIRKQDIFSCVPSS